MSPQSHLRIGNVCDFLKQEFPDVSISKLRFLEEQGLVTPERTPGGYRMYSQEDVRKLRHILQMQRDEFLPLRVIREELERRLAEQPSSGAAAGSRKAPAGRQAERLAVPSRRISREELCILAKVPDRYVEECEQYDIVKGLRGPNGGLSYTEDDAKIVECSAQIARLGVEPRNLKQVRSATSRQSGLIEQIAGPRLRSRNVEQRTQAVRHVEALTEAIAQLMRATFVRDVRVFTSELVAADDEPQRGRAGIINSLATQ